MKQSGVNIAKKVYRNMLLFATFAVVLKLISALAALRNISKLFDSAIFIDCSV